MHADENSGKLRITFIIFGGGCGQKFLNEWMNLADFLHANTYSGKLKVTLVVISWAWSNMGVVFQVMGLYNLLYLKMSK